jgi:DNA-binding transcriptional LysR family regulator
VDFDGLRSFVRFAETRNFTRAARAVGLSQPALFERVRRLGEELGVELYARRGRELVLTDEGVRVLAFAREVEAGRACLDADLSGSATRERVTLAAGEGSYLYLLGPALRAFARDDGATLDLLTLGSKDVVDALLRGEADLGVAVLDLVPRRVEAVDLVRTPLCVAMQRHHRLARKRSVTPADLGGERIVLTPEGQLHRELVSRALGGLGGGVASTLVADGWPLMLQFVELGLGLAVVNGICALPRGVVARPIPALGAVTYRLLWRRGAILAGKAQALAALIRETVHSPKESPG